MPNHSYNSQERVTGIVNYIFAVLLGVWLGVFSGSGEMCAAESAEEIPYGAQMGIGYAGHRLALDRASLEIQTLKKRVNAQQDSLGHLTDSLIEAETVASALAERVKELKKQNEALVPSRVTGDQRVLEQRLLSAVSDLELATNRLLAFEAQLKNLVEACNDYLGTQDTEKRDFLPALLNSVSSASVLLEEDVSTSLAGQAPAVRGLPELRVADYAQEIDLVILNAGKKHGIKTGMVFEIRHGTTPVATVRAFDVRESIAGCIIQNITDDALPIEKGLTAVPALR